LLTHAAFAGVEPGDLSKQGNLAGRIDRMVLPGSFCCYKLDPTDKKAIGDNEGLLSTLPAIATTLLGALAGQWLRCGVSPLLKAGGLIAAGVIALYGGWWWDASGFPVNKILWTSSFVLVAGGWSAILLGLFYFVIDVCRWRWWAFFFIVIGSNAITIYLLQHFVTFGEVAGHFVGGLVKLSQQLVGKDFGNVILYGSILAIKWLVLWFLYRHKVFLRA
jgi:predicted acyltransferase